MSFWKAVSAIIWKDIRAELRTKDIFSSMFVFALLSVIVFSFAFELRVPDMKMVVPGIIWVAITFAGTLGLNRAFVIEQDKGSLAGLLLAPVDRAAIYFGKMFGNLIFIFVVEVILLPLIMIFFNLSLFTWQHHSCAVPGHVRLRGGRHGLLGDGRQHPGTRGHAAHPAVPGAAASAGCRGQDDGRAARRRDVEQHRQLAAARRDVRRRLHRRRVLDVWVCGGRVR